MSDLSSAAGLSAGEGRLTEQDFRALAAIVRSTAGIMLGPNKRELVFGRLNRRLRALGLETFTQYRKILDGPLGDAERVEMINAITTNLTSFFREPHHFSFLGASVIPELLKTCTDRRLRIWSAACSSGEEAYSIAMVLQRALAAKGSWDARILATDIDTNIVRIAQNGQYDAERTATIPRDYAAQLTRQHDGSYVAAEALKQLIAFKPLNLLGEWPMRGKFDVVFCRNVVIYFDKAVQRTLFDRIAEIMTPRGWLFIGHSESLLGASDRFESLGRTIYRKLR
jgi:chemotaxis protein methyltransferase CheR